MRSRVSHTHMRPGCRSQRRTIFDQRFTRSVDRYAMDIRPIRKTVGIRSESTCLLGTVYQIDHARLFFLENIHSQRGFLRIRRTMLSGSRRVHATNQPFRADVLQGRDILVMTIHEDRLIEDYRIPICLIYFFGAYHSSSPSYTVCIRANLESSSIALIRTKLPSRP